MTRILVTGDVVAMLDRRNAEIAALRAERDALRAERDKYRDILFARNGGDPLALLDELDEALSRADALHAALRKVAIRTINESTSCRLCGRAWHRGNAENQNLDCLAAPKEKP